MEHVIHNITGETKDGKLVLEKSIVQFNQEEINAQIARNVNVEKFEAEQRLIDMERKAEDAEIRKKDKIDIDIDTGTTPEAIAWREEKELQRK